jgi:hypothetical protein
MRRTHCGAISRGKKHRHAVGHLDDTHTLTQMRNRCIRRPARFNGCIEIGNVDPMHLLKPRRLSRQPKRVPHAAAVFPYCVGAITDMHT